MIASFSNSRESRTKVTLDHRVSLPETEARTCSVSSASVKKLPVRKASSTEPSQECPLIPFTGANGFKILTLHPESGELHPWSLHPGKYYSEKLEKKKNCLPRFLGKGWTLTYIRCSRLKSQILDTEKNIYITQ